VCNEKSHAQKLNATARVFVRVVSLGVFVSFFVGGVSEQTIFCVALHAYEPPPHVVAPPVGSEALVPLTSCGWIFMGVCVVPGWVGNFENRLKTYWPKQIGCGCCFGSLLCMCSLTKASAFTSYYDDGKMGFVSIPVGWLGDLWIGSLLARHNSKLLPVEGKPQQGGKNVHWFGREIFLLYNIDTQCQPKI